MAKATTDIAALRKAVGEAYEAYAQAAAKLEAALSGDEDPAPEPAPEASSE